MITFKMKSKNGKESKIDDSCHSRSKSSPIIYYLSGHLFTVDCVINGKAAQGIVDSGAQHTIASYSLIKSLKQLNLLQSASRDAPYLRGVNGAPEQPKWKLKAEIQLKGRNFVHDILILENHSEELLLFGTDFNHHARLMIDFYEKTVSFKDEWQRSPKGMESSLTTSQVTHTKQKTPMNEIKRLKSTEDISFKVPQKNRRVCEEKDPTDPPKKYDQLNAALASVALCNSGYRIPLRRPGDTKSRHIKRRSPLEYSDGPPNKRSTSYTT